MTPYRVTKYQIELLTTIAAGGKPDGEYEMIDMNQLVERLSWKPSKESLQFSLRALIKRKMIEKAEREIRRGRRRATYKLTDIGRSVIDPRPPVPAFIETDFDRIHDELEAALKGESL